MPFVCVCVVQSIIFSVLRSWLFTCLLFPLLFSNRDTSKKYSSSFFYFAHFHVGNRNTKSSFLLASCQVNDNAPPTPVFPSYIFAWRRKKYENNNSNDFSLHFSASVYGNQTHLAPIQKLEPGWVYSGGRLCFEILQQLGGYTRVIKAWYPRWQWGRGKEKRIMQEFRSFPTTMKRKEWVKDISGDFFSPRWSRFITIHKWVKKKKKSKPLEKKKHKMGKRK